MLEFSLSLKRDGEILLGRGVCNYCYFKEKVSLAIDYYSWLIFLESEEIGGRF